MLTQVPDPRQFGVAELDDAGEVIGLEEKPRAAQERSRAGRRLHVHPGVHEAVRHLKPSWRGELEITEAIQWLIDDGRKVQLDRPSPGTGRTPGTSPTCSRSTGWCWRASSRACTASCDAGRELIGRVVIERRRARSAAPGSSARSSSARGREVTGSYVGPFTSVAEDCAIADSEIEYSIVLRGASIRGVRRIEASLIGHDVEVTPRRGCPRPTGWCSATTARCRSAHEDPGHRRRRVHRLPLRPDAAGRRLPRLRGRPGHRAGQAHLCGQPGQPGPGGGSPRFTLRPRRHLRRRRCSPRCCPGTTSWSTSRPRPTSTGPSPGPRSSSPRT